MVAKRTRGLKSMRLQARLLTAVWEHEPALLPSRTGPERAAGIYKPAVQRKSNEADHQENEKNTSHTTSLPVNNKNCGQDTINMYLACRTCDRFCCVRVQVQDTFQCSLRIREGWEEFFILFPILPHSHQAPPLHHRTIFPHSSSLPFFS